MGKKRKEWGFMDWVPATKENWREAGYKWIHNETYLKAKASK